MSDKPESPEKIWLIDVDGDEFFKNYVWCDDPAPSPGMEERDAVEYIRADLAKPSEWISGPCPTCQTDPEGNGSMVSGWIEINRTHEECADCRFLYSANPPCKGHFSGPVCCPRFKPLPSPPAKTP